MLSRRLRFINWPLRTKLIVIFILAVVLPALLILVPFTSSQRSSFTEAETKTRLKTLGPYEIARTEQTFQEVSSELERFVTDPKDYDQVQRVLALAAWPISEQTRQELEHFLHEKVTVFMRGAPSVTRIRFYNNQQVLLAEATWQDQEVIVAYHPEELPTPANDLIASGQVGLRTTLSDIYLDDRQHPSMDIVYTLRPVFDTQGRGSILGQIVFTQDLTPTTPDQRLPNLFATLQTFPSSEEAAHVFLLNEQGQLVSPADHQGWLQDVSQSKGFQQAQLGNSGISTYSSPILDTRVIGYHTAFTLPDGPTLTLLIETPTQDLTRQARREGLVTMLLVGVVMIILGSAAIVLGTMAITRPVSQLTGLARQIASGRLDIRIPQQNREDEIGVLNNTFSAMASQMVEVIGRLETRVSERTHNLETVLEIGRVLTNIRDLDTLLQEVVNLIRDRFDEVYHAQVFLIDPRTNRALLRASTGEVGQQLLNQGHFLDVGSQSVIGSVTATGHAVVALDTSHNPIHKRNEFLPDTRAEMALPLRIGDQVIGALDLQSTLPDAFKSQDVELFQGMADQISIAIDNAMLFAESHNRLHEIERLNRSLTETAWRDVDRQQPAASLSAAAGQAFPATREWTPLQLEAMNNRQVIEMEQGDVVTLAVPVLLRDQTVGAIEWRIPKTQFTGDTRQMAQALTARLALTAENIRLFGQTQRALAETERLYETARTVSSAPDLDTVYQLVVEQIEAVPPVDHVEILISGPDPSLVQYLENVYAWSRQSAAETLATHDRVRVVSLVMAEENLLPTDTPVAFGEAADEIPAEHPLRERLQQIHARSGVLAPLSAAGRWFGLLVCTSERAESFQPAYVTFVSALADQLAIAIENRRLFDEAQSEARRVRALAEAGQLASQIGVDYDTGLHNLFQAVAGPANYDRWWFGIMDRSGTRLQRVVASGPITLESVNLQQDANALAETGRIGEIVLVNDPTDHPVVGGQPPDEAERWGKYITTPVRIGPDLAGVLLIGRALDGQNLDERDIQLAATLASQVAIATQNRRLFGEAESQRQNLQTIVNTMPTGILVMDQTGAIVLSNQRLMDLLGPEMRPGGLGQPYPIIQADTREPYAPSNWPLNRVLKTGEPSVVDDIVIMRPDGYETHVLAQAAPVRDAEGHITTAVAAFQDVTEIQELERALQDSLRETTLLYEASRSISRTTSMDDLFQVLLWQVNMLQPNQIYIVLAGDQTRGTLPTLAVTRPTDLAERLDIAQLAPMLGQEAILNSRSSATDTLASCLEQTGMATLASFPLSVRGEAHGWIVIGFADPSLFTSEQRRFMTTLADQSAVSIENQRLLLRMADVLEETAILYHASRVIANSRTPSEILGAFLYQGASIQVHYAALYVLLGEAETTSYAAVELLATWGDHPAADPTGTRHRADQFPFWTALTAPGITQIQDADDMTENEELLRDEFEQLGLHSATIVPLRIAERPVGAIVIGLNTPWPPAKNELRIYRAIADQAAISLENLRLYQQSQRRARQLATSAEVSRAVTSILQLDQLLPQVVDQIRNAFEYDHVQVFLIDEEHTLANLVASTGAIGQRLLERRHNLPVGSQSVIGQVTATGKPQIVLDTANARAIHRPNPLLPHTRSEMALPLFARGHIVGALDVQSSQPGTFTDEDARILSSLADMVATAIDNARLFELSEEHAEEMAFLFRVTSAAAASPDLEESLHQTLGILQSTWQGTGASVFLPDETGEYMVRGGHVGNPSSEMDRALVSAERGLVGWVTRHNQAVLVDDVSQDSRWVSTATNTRSIMATPMQAGGRLGGVLIIESDQVRAFTERDLRLLQTLSSTLAAIVQNSRLLGEVQEANEQLLEVDRLKTNFLAAMSHELRTPLNSIIGFSRVILKGIDGPLTDTQEQDITTIYDSGKHLLGLVNDILDQAKIEAKKMELSFAYFKVQEVVQSVMSSALGLTRDKPVRLHTEIAEELPNAYGDEFRTRQVLLNLISNATKFTEEGSITVSAFPVWDQGQQYVQVSVTDTGIGVAETDIHTMFEPFQQVDNSLTRRVGGTGLGLPLAKSLVELQHGHIWVESQVGVGSTFSITIPVAPPPETEQESSPAPEAQAVTPKASEPPNAHPKRQTIVVIESDVEVINLYRRYLSREGFEVLGVVNPDQVLNAIHTHQPSLIMLDVNMHNQAGWEVLAQLKGHPASATIPVIICSLNPDTQRGFEMGAMEYLVKPFSEDQLLAALRRIADETSRQRILLVDDKPQTIQPFRAALQESRRYEVLEATSGQEALAILQRPTTIDLVILDLRMPEIDGFAVLQALRSAERTANIPVLVLTAEDVTADERTMLEAIELYRKDDLDEQRLIERVEAQLGNPHPREH